MEKILFFLLVLAVGVAGAFLRLYLLNDQIPLNDDWHGLLYSATHSFSELVRSTSSFAHTSPLLNIYRRGLLGTVGWSEILLCLPSLLSGILSLIIFPLCVKKINGRLTAVVFSLFLAISPVLIFYSRVGRPYSLLVFVLFFAVCFGGKWLLTGRTRYLLTYVATSGCAVYLHPVAVVSVFSPLLGSIIYLLLAKTVQTIPLKVRPASIILTGILLALISISMLQPSLTMTRSAMGNNELPDLDVWRQFLMMLFGTSSVWVALLMTGISVAGGILLFIKNLLWGLIFGLLFPLNGLSIAVGHFIASDVAIVLVRYLIILFPVTFFCAAVALARWMECRRGVGILTGSLILVVLVATSPLWEIYSGPNNFTGHSAFQESYERHGFDKLRKSLICPELNPYLSASLPDFYRQLSEATGRLIEYPMVLGDCWNHYYFYQQQHGKNIVAGYSQAVSWEHDRTDGVYGNCLINHVLPKVRSRRGFHFRNLVNIDDPDAVRMIKADYLIIHRNLIREFYNSSVFAGQGGTPELESYLSDMTERYGNPVYEDKQIVVFDLADQS